MEYHFKQALIIYIVVRNVCSTTTPLKRPRPGDPFDTYPKNFWQEFSSPFTDSPEAYDESRTETTIEERQPYFSEEHFTHNISSEQNLATCLQCRVNNLRGKTVSWMRRKGDELELITFSKHTYSSDARYSLSFEDPNNWKLCIKAVRKEDEGHYECQVSTHPPLVLVVNLSVTKPRIEIVDERFALTPEKFYKAGSTIELNCIITNITQNEPFVLWEHGKSVLNYDLDRGGISVKTDLLPGRIVSKLYVANSRHGDSGDYTCLLNSQVKATITVHIITERPAAILHSGVENFKHSNSVSVFMLSITLRYQWHLYDISSGKLTFSLFL